MTDKVDMLGDKSLQELGLRLSMDYQHPGAPDTRDHTMIIDGMAGAWDFGADVDSLPFALPCGLITESPEALQHAIRAVTSHLFDVYGKPKTMKLILSEEPDKYYMVRYSGSLAIQRIIKIGKFTIPLTAFDPYAYFIVQSDEIIWGSDVPILSDVVWDTGIGEYGLTSPQTIKVINNGSIVVRSSFTVTGSGDDVVFACNGQSFSLGSFTGTTWEIDGKGYSVKKDGVSDMSPFISGGSPIDLLPGDNLISATGSNLDLTITENLRYKYN